MSRLGRVDWMTQERLETRFSLSTNELDGRGGLGEHPPLNITRASGGPNTRFAAVGVSAVHAPRLVLLLRVSYDTPDTHGIVVLV